MNITRKIWIALFCIILLVPILGGAAGSDNDEVLNYFPLHVGDVRIYKFKSAPAEQREEVIYYDKTYNTYTVSFVNKVADLAPIQTQNIYEARFGKILSLAETDLKTGKIKLRDTPLVVLSSPIKVGSVWERVEEKGKTVNKIVGFESVIVEAGKFNNVCIVERSIYVVLPNKSKQVLCLVTREYYAPKVGLIKQETHGTAIDDTGITPYYRKFKTPEVDFELAKYTVR